MHATGAAIGDCVARLCRQITAREGQACLLSLSGVISVAFIANRVAAEMSTAFRKLISVATEDKRAEATVNRRDERGAAILRAFHANKHIRGIME